MKTITLILILWIFQSIIVFGQCEKNISTNPNAPVNDEFLNLANEWHSDQGPYTVNSFLNHWSWYPPSNTQFNLNLSQGWENNLLQSLSMPMDNPFFATGTTTFIHQQASTWQYRDFRWEDGWELLWMNMGIHPNLDQALSPSVGTYYEANGITSNPLPTNVPYFVLYNRYRGVLRIFANIWTDNLQPNAQEVLIGLRFDQFAAFDNGLSGILRHSINYDTPLDQPTAGVAHFSPRMQATNTSSFLVADFQMAFDPCICLRETDPYNSDLGKLEFDFQTFQTMDIDMVSRSVSVQDPITAASFTDDFYNLSEINSSDYVPGHRIYTKMDGLYEDYLDKLQKYQDELDAQDDDYNFLKAFLGKVAPALTNDFVGSWTTADVVAKLKEDPDLAPLADQEVEEMLEEQRKKRALKFKTGDFTTKALKSLAKGILGIGFDYLNLELFPKKATPVKPTTPVATFTESLYKGTISNTNVSTSSQLYQPGGVTFSGASSSVGYGHGIVDLDYRNMPAYNKVLGQAALLTTPVTDFFFDTNASEFERYGTGDNQILEEGEDEWISFGVVQEMSTPIDIKFKLPEELKFALNNSLDFDLEQTTTYFSLEIVLQNEMKSNDLWTWWDIITDETVTREFSVSNNLDVTNYMQTDDGRTLQLNSEWIELSDLNQYIFSADFSEEIVIEGSTFSLDYFPFDPAEAVYEVSQIKLKVMHDFYFDQIGYLGEQINTTQVHTYLMFDDELAVNFMTDIPSEWSNTPTSGMFDEYLIGQYEIGNAVIYSALSDPLVTEVSNGNTIIHAQTVVINGNVTVSPIPSNDALVVEALEVIHLVSGAHIDSELPEQVQLSIKKDFYSTPIFQYVDDLEVENFCTTSSTYQANIAAAAIMTQLQNQSSSNEYANTNNLRGSIQLFPNPARELLTLRSSHLDMSAITIHDLSGRPIKQETLQAHSRETQINLSGIVPGTYIVRVDCGDEVFSEKLVVTR